MHKSITIFNRFFFIHLFFDESKLNSKEIIRGRFKRNHFYLLYLIIRLRKL